MEIKKRKYYFLPFWDHLLAILISLLFTMFFGSWFQNKIFGFIMGIAMTLVMCGLLYSRMWKLSRKNTRYGCGLVLMDSVKFALPLVLFTTLLVLFFYLAQKNVIPLQDMVQKIYYTFPDNLPRQVVQITAFDYLTIFTRFWFSYFLGFTQNSYALLFLLSPILMLLSSIIGFSFGSKNKEILDGYIKTVQKTKEKFNE